MPPPPRPAPQVSPDARTDRVAFFTGSKPQDSNGNGFPDVIVVTAALFDSRYRSPFWEDGSLVIWMYPQGGYGAPGIEPLAEWRIEGERFEQAKFISALAGPQYRFELSLLQASGTDRFPLMAADLKCRFEPADGRSPVYCQGVRSIQIGRHLTAGPGF